MRMRGKETGRVRTHDIMPRGHAKTVHSIGRFVEQEASVSVEEQRFAEARAQVEAARALGQKAPIQHLRVVFGQARQDQERQEQERQKQERQEQCRDNAPAVTARQRAQAARREMDAASVLRTTPIGGNVIGSAVEALEILEAIRSIENRSFNGWAFGSQ